MLGFAANLLGVGAGPRGICFSVVTFTLDFNSSCQHHCTLLQNNCLLEDTQRKEATKDYIYWFPLFRRL
jgi:hypothetical protein